MANANVIDISYFQDSSKLDWQAIKDAGIEAVIICAGYGKTQDTQAAAHIANANKYGLKWHLYHYWYNMGDEAEWAVQNAKILGMTANQYLFLDMEDKSLPADWNGQFAVFRKAVGDIFQVGLYCSDSTYKEKFQDSQLQQLKVYRWVALYSYEPANYDMWQMSGASSGGFGKYTADIDRDFDKSRRLIADSEPQSPDKQPIVPPTLTTDMPYIRGIVSQPGFDTESGIWGYGYSPDNGENFYVNDTVFGRKYRQEDADRIWPYLKGFVKDQLKDAIAGSVSWDNVEGKPDMDHYYTKDEVDQKMANAVTGGQVDLSGYLTLVQADSRYATKSQLEQAQTRQGPPGKDGKSAYEIAVDHGFSGSQEEWLKSLHGKDGTSSSSGGGTTPTGDNSLSIEAISELIEDNLTAKIDKQGNLVVDTGDIDTNSITGAISAKVLQAVDFSLDNGNLKLTIGGAK